MKIKTKLRSFQALFSPMLCIGAKQLNAKLSKLQSCNLDLCSILRYEKDPLKANLSLEAAHPYSLWITMKKSLSGPGRPVRRPFKAKPEATSTAVPHDLPNLPRGKTYSIHS